MIIDVLICNPDGTQELVSRDVELPPAEAEESGEADTPHEEETQPNAPTAQESEAQLN